MVPLLGGKSASGAMRKLLSTSRYFWSVFGINVAVFFVSVIIWTYSFYWRPVAVPNFMLALSVICLAMSTHRKGLYSFPLGATCLLTLAAAAFIGIFIYDNYSFYQLLYENSRTYQDTVPSQFAASVADAGKLVFASEAYLDQSQAVGYAAVDGHKYCVAPIRDLTDSPTIQFWAVGYDCCDWEGTFKCDAAESGAVSGAHGGIVVFDNNARLSLSSNKDKYELARRKAEATFDLVSSDAPIYVRWVETADLDMLKTRFMWQTRGLIFLSTVVWAAVSFIMATTLLNSHYKAFQSQLPQLP